MRGNGVATRARMRGFPHSSGLRFSPPCPPVSKHKLEAIPMPVQTLTMPRARRRARGRTISVFVVDDHPAVHRGVESLLGAQPDLRVAGSASEAKAALVDIACLT